MTTTSKPKYSRPTEFEQLRRRAWSMFISQCRYRGEVVELEYRDWCEFYPDQASLLRRGRNSDSWCLTRRNEFGAWSRANTCQIPRKDLLWIKNRRMFDLDCEHLYTSARFL